MKNMKIKNVISYFIWIGVWHYLIFKNCKHNIIDTYNYYLKYKSDATLTYKLNEDFIFTLVTDFSSIIIKNDKYNNLYSYILYDFKLDELNIHIYLLSWI